MKSITVEQLAEREGVPLIDVRERHEFEAGHVPGAINLPMSELGGRSMSCPVRRSTSSASWAVARAGSSRCWRSAVTMPRTSTAAPPPGSPRGAR